MVRDYRSAARGSGVWVPRWLVVLVSALVLLWLGLRILIPPSWIVQQLDSPDGKRSARLMRSRYVKDSFVIRVRDGKLWRTAFYSLPLDTDLRVDLGERILWTNESSRLLFRIQDSIVWGYDFQRRSSLSQAEIAPYNTD